jgi:hypothetical protein
MTDKGRRIGGMAPGVAALAAALIALGGCTYQGPVTGGGTTTVTLLPGRVPPMPNGQQLPGGAIGNSSVPAFEQGTYRGTAQALTNFGANCPNTFEIDNFVVNGRNVTFSTFLTTISATGRSTRLANVRFDGDVEPDGGLRLQWRNFFLIGQFQGPHFTGHLWQPQPGCTYLVNVSRM